MCSELANDLTLLENALFWSKKNGSYDTVQKMLNNSWASKGDILNFCNPRFGKTMHPCTKVKMVRNVDNDETRVFDAIYDFDGPFYLNASKPEQENMRKLLLSLYELYDFQHFLYEMDFMSTNNLKNLQEEFSRAVAWYLGRIDEKNAGVISLRVASVLSDAPLTKDGLQKCANDLANELGDIRYHIVNAIKKRLQKF
jgi:hypothetical protein